MNITYLRRTEAVYYAVKYENKPKNLFFLSKWNKWNITQFFSSFFKILDYLFCLFLFCILTYEKQELGNMYSKHLKLSQKKQLEGYEIHDGFATKKNLTLNICGQYRPRPRSSHTKDIGCHFVATFRFFGIILNLYSSLKNILYKLSIPNSSRSSWQFQGSTPDSSSGRAEGTNNISNSPNLSKEPNLLFLSILTE